MHGACALMYTVWNTPHDAVPLASELNISALHYTATDHDIYIAKHLKGLPVKIYVHWNNIPRQQLKQSHIFTANIFLKFTMHSFTYSTPYSDAGVKIFLFKNKRIFLINL